MSSLSSAPTPPLTRQRQPRASAEAAREEQPARLRGLWCLCLRFAQSSKVIPKPQHHPEDAQRGEARCPHRAPREHCGETRQHFSVSAEFAALCPAVIICSLTPSTLQLRFPTTGTPPDASARRLSPNYGSIVERLCPLTCAGLLRRSRCGTRRCQLRSGIAGPSPSSVRSV